MVGTTRGGKTSYLRKPLGLYVIAVIDMNCSNMFYHHAIVGHRRDGINYKLTTHATRLLMDQLVPASYLELEDTVRKIAQHYHNQQKPPVLTAQEFRYVNYYSIYAIGYYFLIRH